MFKCKQTTKMNRKKTKNDSVLKRSKSEVVKATLGSYLKRRNYASLEPVLKIDPQLSGSDNCLPQTSHSLLKVDQLSQSREQMAISTAIENDVTRNNSILYSCINNDTSQVDQQFTKFFGWVSDLATLDCRAELIRLIIPLFCHLYLEMLKSGNKDVAALAATFLMRYKGPLSSDSNLVNHVPEVLEELTKISCTEDIDSKPIVKAFRSCKYQLPLSLKSMACLNKYLTVHGHLILFQVLQTWFDLEINVTSNGLVSLEDEEDDAKTELNEMDQHLSHLAMKDAKFAKPGDSDERLRQLQEAIRLLKEDETPPIPLLLYTIVNANQNLSSASISESQRLVAAGCLSSEVRVYRIPGSRNLGDDFPDFTPATTNNPVAHVKLACDEVLPSRSTQRITYQDRRCASLYGHSKAVYDVALVPKADTIVSVSADSTMRAWNLNDYSCAAVYRGHNYPVYSVDVSTLCVYLATASHDRTARLWSLDRTFCLRIFAGHQQEVNVVKFHPNGSYLATASADKTVRLWSVGDGKMVRVLPGHKGGVYSLAFSPNGKYIASAGEDKRVRIWDLAEGKELKELKGHEEPIVGLDWSSRTNYLASCSADGVVRRWGVKNITELDVQGSDVLSCETGCISVLNLKFTHRNTLLCIGTV